MSLKYEPASEQLHISASRPTSPLDDTIAAVFAGEVSRGEKMLSSGTDPESYITEYTLVYEE